MLLRLHLPTPDRIELSLEVPNQPVRRAAGPFSFALTDQQHERLRWYFEEYLIYPMDPAPAIARGIEDEIKSLGAALFGQVFGGSDAGRLWETVRPNLSSARIEISTPVREANSIPWELLRDPDTETCLALAAQSFVRAHATAKRQPVRPTLDQGPVRLLLVICRPGGAEDVPFRSVARRVLKALTPADPKRLAIEVLRPPTFAKLAETLRAAHREKRPFHIVHFDGHGGYGDLTGVNPALLLDSNDTGEHGRLLFENANVEKNVQYVRGTRLGNLLYETGCPVLLLNACRSAHAEPAPQPFADPHLEIRAFGSVAQEVMDSGATGVLAMRYNVFVETAASFVEDLYKHLAEGCALGEAATLARKGLHDQPLRAITFDPRPLQDWAVPIVFEAAPVALWAKSQAGGLTLNAPAPKSALPAAPDTGFIGRDEAILAIDRAFDAHHLVLLHAYAGSGKTSTAAEFASWYESTGFDGPVFFTSFERHVTLARVLDKLEPVYQQVKGNAPDWLSLSDEQRRAQALQIFRQLPVLWIWDNVEPVSGFPKGTPSAWTAKEQDELAAFLGEARGTKAKFLLTSRRDEQAWLHDLPHRIPLRPMRFEDMLGLARALAERRSHRITDVEDWRPLLRFAQGNPMTVTVLVGEALRQRYRTGAQIQAFVDKLRAGESVFPDEAGEGRTRSLGASLNYGFEQAFTEPERKQLALLHLFQGFVNVEALRLMKISGLTRESGIGLLDRATEIGLLSGHGNGYYGIHPAVPWFFRRLFEQYYGAGDLTTTQAYVEAIGALGDHYHDEYGSGKPDVIGALSAEEANLLHARRLAIRHSWWPQVIAAMQGLQSLYQDFGRKAEWARLVEEVTPLFIDASTGGPIPGRDDEWSLVTEYRVWLAIDARLWAEAEQLQLKAVAWNRQRAATALAIKLEELTSSQRHDIRSLAVSLQLLGRIQVEQSEPECAESLIEAFHFAQQIRDEPLSGACASILGNAYSMVPAIRNLDEAERWYKVGLQFKPASNHLGRARSLGQLGFIAYERFTEARNCGQPSETLLGHLNAALRHYREALQLTPQDAIGNRATVHNQLGGIYRVAGDTDTALHHFRESIRYEEAAGNLYGAAQSRFNAALALANANCFPEALHYAHAALRDFQSFGERAQSEIERTLRLIARIESRLPS